MKHIYYKIRDHYLELLQSETKKREYRLADEKASTVAVGDVLVLVSNQDKNKHVKVSVNKISHYSSWQDAIANRWQEDFGLLFASEEDVLKECYRFYPKAEVDRYGIDVFDVSLQPKKSYKKAKYLFDTNIIIERESENNVLTEVVMATTWIDKLQGTKLIHPKTIEEIQKYGDKAHKENLIKKLSSYNALIPSNERSVDFNKVVGAFPLDQNSLIDNEILFQVFSGIADYLITNDLAILNKARILRLREKVITPNEFLCDVEKEFPKLISYDVLSIKLTKIGNINPNDEFFDTLRDDYNGAAFNNWLLSKNGEDAYVFERNGKINGFLYLKTEDKDEPYPYFFPTFKPAKRLKVGCFKISYKGNRLGERFLKIIFDNAIKRNVDEIYVTMFKDKREEVKALKSLMEQWGFEEKAVNTNNGEIILVKDMKNYDETKTPKFNYPKTKSHCCFGFLPIESKWHTRLFPDLHLRNENLNIYDEEACRYAIEKTYVCGWKRINNKPGDILCVYRIGDFYKKYTSVITGMVILERIIYPNSEEEFIDACKNKSVFSEDELRMYYREGKYKTILKVLYLKSFNNKIILKNLQDANIISENSGARIDTYLSKEGFSQIRKMGER